MEQKITINVNSTHKYLQLWNGIFNLTSTELRVLSALVDTAITLEEENICAVKVKKQAARLVGQADFNTLNNYVKKIKDKGALRINNRKYTLNRLLDLSTKKVEVNIKWNE